MSEAFDLYNLFFLALAVVVFLRLRSVLGRRTGNERKPYDPYTARERADGGQKSAEEDKIITLPGSKEREGVRAAEAAVKPAFEKYAPKGSPLAKGLAAIYEADRSFDPGKFLEGAKVAYEMIVTAFAQSDRRTLKDLLSSEVYDGFNAAIEAREKKGETMQSNFVGIEKADLIEASLKGKKANVTVKFVSELVSATYDAEGELIEGDPKKVREVTDIWTFMRDVSSRNPNWKLVATEAAQ